MKAILVIDEMPQDCLCCPCYRQAQYEYLEDCAVALRPLTVEERDNRPSWCPLKPLPQKKKVKEINTIDDFMESDIQIINEKVSATMRLDTELLLASGYNLCVDELLGAEE